MKSISLEEHLLGLLDHPAICVNEGRLTYWNSLFEDLISTKESPISGKLASELEFLDSENRSRFLDKLHNCSQSLQPIEDVPFIISHGHSESTRFGSFFPFSTEKVHIVFKTGSKEDVERQYWLELYHEYSNVRGTIVEYDSAKNDCFSHYSTGVTIRDEVRFGNGSIYLGYWWREKGRFTDDILMTWINKAKEVIQTRGTTTFIAEVDVPSYGKVRFANIMKYIGLHPQTKNHLILMQTNDLVELGKAESEIMKIELENSVKNRTSHLEQALQVKSRFLAVMSHEMRTPLTGIMGMLSLLSDVDLPIQNKEMLQAAQICGEQLLSVINDVLDLTKMEENKIELERRPISLRQTIEDSMETVSNRNDKNLELIVNIDPEIQDHLYGDSARLRQILVNLLSNALKFSECGDIMISACSRYVKDSLYEVQISVSDQGIGISPDAQQRLFQPFIQADSSITRKFGGTGLGLSIAKRYCELMGGKLTCESQIGKGTTFHVTIYGEKHTEFTDQMRLLYPRFDHVVIVHRNPQTRISIIRQILQWKKYSGSKFSEYPNLVSLLEAMARDPKFRERKKCVAFVDVDEWDNFPDTSVVLASIKLVLMGNLHTNKLRPCRYLKKPFRSVNLQSMLFISASEAERSPSPVAITPAASSDRSLRILVAEDNIINQKVIKQMLMSAPYDLVGLQMVDNGKLALEMTKNERFDLVLMDLMMPVMDGLLATKFIRSELDMIHQPYIVALTASAFAEDEQRCLEAGMNEVVTKPINRALLHAAMGRAISSRQISQMTNILDQFGT